MAIEKATGGGTRTMKASEFKAKCLALMDEIAESGEEIVITSQRRGDRHHQARQARGEAGALRG